MANEHEAELRQSLANVKEDLRRERERAADLLAALEAVLPWHDAHPLAPPMSAVVAQCRAAIAAARGV